MKAYYRGPDGMPRTTGDLQANSNFLHHPVRVEVLGRPISIVTCAVPMEGTCPHGWTLSRLPLPPVLPAPLGPIDPHGVTLDVAEWVSQADQLRLGGGSS